MTHNKNKEPFKKNNCKQQLGTNKKHLPNDSKKCDVPLKLLVLAYCDYYYKQFMYS